MTDRQLIERHLRENAPDALCELVQRHINMVHAAARQHAGDPTLAEDVTQAVFLLLVRRAARLSQETSIAGWLYKTTWYVASEMRRQNQRRSRREREALNMDAPSSADPVIATMSAEDRTALYAAIARLPADDREAIVLSYLEGCTSAEIAATLGASQGAVRTRLTRARERLRRLLGHAGIAVTAAALAATLDISKARAAPLATLARVQGLVRGAAPGVHIQSLVTGVLKMSVRTKQLLFAAAALIAAAFVLGLVIMTRSTSTAPPQITPSAATPPVVAPPPAAVLPPPATSPVALAAQNTPKSAVLAAYHDALAGDQDAFLTHFGGLSDDGKPMPIPADQQNILRAVARVMHAFDLLLTAVGEKFGPDVQKQFAQQTPLYVDPADMENVTVLQVDANHAVVNMGKSGPGKVAVVRVNDAWLVDSSVLATVNDSVVTKVDGEIGQINALTAAVNAGRFADAASFNRAVSGAMLQ